MRKLVLSGLWGIGWLLNISMVMAGQTTRIAGATCLADAPSVIAEARGFFTQQGVDANLELHDSCKS